MGHTESATLALLTHPYRRLIPLDGGKEQLWAEGKAPGSSVIWSMGRQPRSQELDLVRSRPGGTALLIILPHAININTDHRLVQLVQSLRPHGILPHHLDPDVEDLHHLLRRPPSDLSAEMTEYLAWRGIKVDRDTTRMIRRIADLSSELRSISAVARAMYISRRALGRRFVSRGLPVPSHWLHFSRLLRVAVKLQSTELSVFAAAYSTGYTDAFSLSNQMQRLIGVRPSKAREFVGWEWIMESWLRREAEAGRLVATHEGPAKGVRTGAEPASVHRRLSGVRQSTT